MPETESHSPFEILAPARWTAPVVFNSPHSGSFLPDSFLRQARLTAAELHASEDTHVDDLFQGCLDAGAPLLRARFSRAYLDLNREPYEFDARMFRERLPAYMNVSSPRVASGLGTIPRTVGDGLTIYASAITLDDALARVEQVYRPYHRALAALLDEAKRAAGQVLLVDCHSMPSTAVPARHQGGADVVLGDRFGAACEPAVTAMAEEVLVAHGLTVQRNRPYAGGFFTECHGRPREGRQALQIEVNRALYMDERTRLPNTGYAALRVCLTDLCARLAAHMEQAAANPALAAE